MSISARILLVLAASALFLTPACSEQAEDTARGLVIVNSENSDRPYFHDFGEVPHGRVVEHTFELLNTDPVPVTIRDLLPSCGCTVPAIHYIDAEGTRVQGNARAKGEVLVIPPGATAYITMKTNSREVTVPNRDKLALIRLRSDSLNTAYITFELHLVVRLLFQATPTEISMGQVPESVGGSSFSEIISALKGSEAELLEIESSDPVLETSLVKSVRFATTLWTLTAKLPPGQKRGPYMSDITLKTTDMNGEGESGRFEVRVLAQVVEDVLASPPTLAVGRFPRAEGSTLSTQVRTLIPGHRILLEGYEAEGLGSDEIEVQLLPNSADDGGRASEWTVALTIPPNASLDTYSGVITLKLDDPEYKNVRIPYSGMVLAN